MQLDTISDARPEAFAVVTSRHLLHLDFLRGIAALAVAIGHRRPWFGEDVLPHSFLAVDFFFILSGFVIDRAYRDKIGARLSASRFIAVRMVRLYPLIALSVVLGLVVALARARAEGGDYSNLIASAGAHLLFIPGVGSDKWPYPLNEPMWSLFFELAANFAFLLIAPLLGRRALIGIVVVTGVGLAWITLDSGSIAHGHLLDKFTGGFLRVGFGFFAGCLLNRLYNEGAWPQVRLGGWTPVVLIAIFQLPRTGADPWFEFFCVAVAFPLMVLAGARARSAWPKIEALSGELSYPLYILHLPLLFLLAGSLRAAGLADGTPSVIEGLARILIVCVMAWIAYVTFDKPVRSWLTARIRK